MCADTGLPPNVAAPQRNERPDVMAAVILRCGDGKPEGDGRRQRSALLRELVGLMPVRSYGLCVNNARWPQGAERDKMVN